MFQWRQSGGLIKIATKQRFYAASMLPLFLEHREMDRQTGAPLAGAPKIHNFTRKIHWKMIR